VDYALPIPGPQQKTQIAMASRNRIRFLVRMIVYIAVVLALYLNRGGFPWRRLTEPFQGAPEKETTLVIAGRDLAPALIDRLITHYRQDYPDLRVTATGSGTNQALEDLLNGRAGAAFMYRRPDPGEEDLFRTIDGDTAIVAKVAVGGVILVAGESAEVGPVTPGEVRAMFTGDTTSFCERFYVPEPNEGLWDAFREEIDLPDPPVAGPLIVFLADAGAVLDAVGRDKQSWGMVSSLNSNLDPAAAAPADVRFVAVKAGPDSLPALPTYENVARGVYPLHHWLYVVCRENGSREGGRFLTHLASARGLRQVERAGVIPASAVLREIHLTTTPVEN